MFTGHVTSCINRRTPEIWTLLPVYHEDSGSSTSLECDNERISWNFFKTGRTQIMASQLIPCGTRLIYILIMTLLAKKFSSFYRTRLDPVLIQLNAAHKVTLSLRTKVTF